MTHMNSSVHTSVVDPAIFMSTTAGVDRIADDDFFEPAGTDFTPGSAIGDDSLNDRFFAASADSLVAKGWSIFPQEKIGQRKPGSVKQTVIAWKAAHHLHEKLPSADALRQWKMFCPSLNVAAVLGAGSGFAFAIDVDVLDEAASNRIRALAFEILGRTPLCRVGRAPKIALLYRHAPDDALLYARCVLQQTTESGETNGLEILCGGRPLTLLGRHHKTGNHFRWLDANPMLVGPEAAPLVTSDQVEQFLAAVDAEFPFVASPTAYAPGSEGCTWGAASGDIRIPRTEGDQLVAHGREAALLTFAARLVKANGEAVMAADGADQVRELSENLAGICAAEFAKVAVTGDSKWPASRVLSESRSKVSSAIRKIISGAFKPTARPEAAQIEKVAPKPAFRLADVPIMDGAPTVLLGAGDTYQCDETTVFVNRTNGSAEEYAVGSVKVEIDYAAREAAKVADREAMASRRAEKKAARKAEAEAAAAAEKDGEEGGRPLIRIDTGRIDRVVDEVEQAIIRSGRGLYQRGGQIVALGETPVMTSEGEIRITGAFEQKEHAIFEMMSASARFEKFDGRKNKFAPTDLPMIVAKTYQQRVGRWNLPVLTGLASAPTLRSDGSILDVEGYDARTGLYVDFGGAEYARVPEAPTKEDAVSALGVLKGLISTFPFVTETYRSVALSCMLTATVRRSLRTAPLHAFSAPVAGSGKSKLSDIASILASGREAAIVSQGATEEEFEKRLGAAFLAGEPVISVDNCTQPVGGKFMCSALTSPVVSTRILGKSESPKLATDALMTVNGNNLSLLEDMDRRFLLSRLDPACERPQHREFASDPVAVAKATRAELVVAALTVLRAYRMTNRAAKLTDLGSFSEWSGWVREALVWLGEADPVDMSETASLDVATDSLTAVLVQWNAAVGQKKLSVRDLIQAATEIDQSVGYSGRSEFARPDFREALIAVAGEGGAVNTRRLAKFLASRADRIVSGMSIRKAGIRDGIQLWTLRK